MIMNKIRKNIWKERCLYTLFLLGQGNRHATRISMMENAYEFCMSIARNELTAARTAQLIAGFDLHIKEAQLEAAAALYPL